MWRRGVFVSIIIASLVVPISIAGAGLPPGGTFTDDNGNPHEGMIEAIVAVGVTNGCDVGLYCPGRSVTRGQMASFLVRAFELSASATDYFTDDETNAHQANINALAAAGVTLGCDTGLYCPDDQVPRAQMATFLARAMGLAPSDVDAFTDDDGSVHEAYIDALAVAGITAGCGAGTYCPTAHIPRDQMASLVGRALGLEPVDVPPPTTTTTSTTTTTVATTTTTQPQDDGQGYGCHPAYVDCVPNHPVDVDCAGGSGNGPVYVQGPIRLVNVSNDPYGLDSDNDGIGCET